MKYKAMTAAEVTQPGAYEWVDDIGIKHVGFLKIDARGRISGSFVDADCHSCAISLKFADGAPIGGQFFGPLALPSTVTSDEGGA